MRPPFSPIKSRYLFPPRTTTSIPSLLTIRNVPAPHLGHIRILGLNNPKSRNAISRQLLSELSTEINNVKEQVDDEAARGEVVGEGTRALVLASEVDEAFCAGADLKERKDMSMIETKAFLTTLRSTLQAIETLPVPTIAAVSSLALGGGLELALATDLRVFASTAMVGLPETRLGIIPGAGGTYRLQRLIGKAETLNLILSGRRINGIQAHRMGICERFVRVGEADVFKDQRAGESTKETVLRIAITMAEVISEGAPGAVQAALRAVREGTKEAEEREYERVVGMGDRDEALRAFGEKRPPVFQGRLKGTSIVRRVTTRIST